MDLRLGGQPATGEELAAIAGVLGSIEPDGGRVVRGGHLARARRHLLLPALHALQDRVGWISRGAVDELARRLSVAPAEIHGVATFYHLLSTEPGPRRRVLGCDDVACLAAGVGPLPPGHERSSCLGRCEQAAAGPVTTVLEAPASVELPDPGEFGALRRARELGPAGVIAELAASGLVGRGGAAFPTARKWEAVARGAAPRYVVCNADESEPGTFKDRWLLEKDPYRVLEGMLVCALAVGAERGYVYLREEYPQARAVLEEAIRHLPDGALEIEVRRGAGAYVCGEETALFNSLEGKRGEPRNRPPFPVERGLFGRPTVINNVETLAAVTRVLEEGPAAARRKLFSVSGAVDRPGVYEVQLGTPLGELIRLAGGVRGTLRAVLLGGAAGTLLGPDRLELPLDFGAGATLGSGSVVVVDQSIDLGQVMLRIARFFREESCGQCVPCRVGTVRQEEALRRLLEGRPLGGREAELERLRELAQVMRDASICGLGQTASAAIQSGLRL